LVDQTRAWLEKGRTSGVMPPKAILVGVPEQVRALIPDDPWQSRLLVRFRQMASDLEDEDATRLRGAALHAYSDEVAPALRGLLQYLEKTYLPAAPEALGMSALPDGAAWYACRLRKAITVDLAPQQVHELGVAEVKRLRAEMDGIRAAV